LDCHYAAGIQYESKTLEVKTQFVVISAIQTHIIEYYWCYNIYITFDLLLGERTVGRPKRRWIEEVERELKGMGVKDWKRLALERDKWKKIVEEAKA
jgi:hypothetical protein